MSFAMWSSQRIVVFQRRNHSHRHRSGYGSRGVVLRGLVERNGIATVVALF
jgi:hypothetical protein